jgi:opacity protein-like surface antigen
MSKTNFSLTVMAALAAITFFSTPSFAQTKANPYAPKIRTPNTKSELVDKSPAPRAENKDVAEEVLEDEKPARHSIAPAARQLQQHGIGLGLGETFLLGDYGKHGQDKITADILYTYAASHSFDLLIDAHSSEHKDNRERMRVRGLDAAIKARFVEFDNFSPFLLGGLGFYAPQAYRRVNTTYKWTDQKITFGLNFGAGADLRLNDKFVVGVMGTMHWPFKVAQDSGSDLKGYYFKLLLTGMYLF